MVFTKEQLEEAKEYLRRRLDSEFSMERDVESILGYYAGRLLRILFSGGGEEDVNILIEEMCSELLSDCLILGVDDRTEDRDMILAYMTGGGDEDSLEGLIGKRGSTFLGEVTAVYLAGKLLGLDERSLLSSIKANLKHPWDNEVLIAVREKIRRGEIDGEIEDFDSPHFGTGIEISSMGALQTITTSAIADAWMWWQHEDAAKQGAKGYFVLRGSSYPCDTCQAIVDAGFHQITDMDSIPPQHAHCCCFVVYSYVERL